MLNYAYILSHNEDYLWMFIQFYDLLVTKRSDLTGTKFYDGLSAAMVLSQQI